MQRCNLRCEPGLMKSAKPPIDPDYHSEPRGRIPSLANIEEKAAFWDTHDTAE
jgi:hypothetical protein